MDLRESRVTEMIQRDDRSKWLSYSNHNIKCFTKGEMGRITSNYGNIIGKGSFGEVYKGILQDGSTVAVKRFVHNVEEDFAKELKVHSEINHRNVVRLIGYCAEENALTIVTEYISKGNLSDVLHNHCISILLDTRLQIAVECSEALAYMHSQMYTQVIHGDIKPSNILLDDNFNAKISDFGVSRLVNTDATLFTEHVMGSIGYMDPLFARTGRLTSKSDVYSFGIVLLELITKKKATTRNGKIGIVECFTQALATQTITMRELFDVEISSQNNMKVLEAVAKLAGECLRMEMDRRLEMVVVAERLRALRKTQVQGKQMLIKFPWGWRNKPSNLCRHFSLTEMKSATGNFNESHLVGLGRSGKVYYGLIDEGATEVAIKRGIVVQDVNFHEEIARTEKLRHHHLLSLLGYCKENDEMILIYDYMAHGTLHGRLYGYNTEEPPLTWRQRLDVCIGAARALYYLHKRSIIHGDLTTTKILLDKTWVAKVSLSRAISPKQHYWCNDKESDVYSFGVMLFEVLCARAAFDLTLPRNQLNLVECAQNCKKKGILDLIVDPYLEGKIAPRCLNKFFKTAQKCVTDHPSMREVLKGLEMCLSEQSRGLGDDTSGDDGTNRPSTEERRHKLEMYLQEESGSNDSEVGISDGNESGSYLREKFELPE
ncbi:leucine-rich repeat receptor protein kinase HPCA1-like [Lolium rigidum]|uniref:leucine-rich repeat receptor protein kinase HPCA1-like n=1 Tax=Lolium rigidum TaxID=89674 RepID=UPI001F5E2C82|nr:leucine-rich repeat receptor protein kinase HPCA1-like [Lolium rigidum]